MDYIQNLISKALEARTKAYVPYSNFKVGAALLTKTEKIYSGFNIECAAYSVCNCAERTALFRAVFDGERKFSAIAVVGGPGNKDIPEGYCPPCGMCRQALREFCSPSEMKVILARTVSDFKVLTLDELLPYSFGPEHL